MYLRRGSFRWPCGRNGTMHMSSPDAACPGLHRKPRDALPLADCSLCIALAADGAAINKTTTEKCMSISMAIATPQYNTVGIAR